MLFFRGAAVATLVLVFAVASWAPFAVAGETTPSLEGSMTVNGEKVEFSHIYVYAQEKGFYDEADPTWTVLFVEHPIEERELDDHIWESAYIRLGVTKTAEFGDEPELQVYSQDIRFKADSGGNVSGGTYPEIELTDAGPDSFAGRVFHAEMQEFFDDAYQYDFTFSAPMSDPFGPIGDPLPAGGGKPGADYLAFTEAVHAGDFDALMAFMSPEQREMLEDESIRAAAEEDLEFMQLMTPKDLEILSGSSDGQTAILKVKGTMEGEAVEGDVTLENMDGIWFATNTAWQ